MTTSDILIQEASKMVETCEQHKDKMSDWERKFIVDMRGRLTAKYWLTDNQKEAIRQVHTRVTKDE